jgi:hypothetical protein
MDRVIPGQAVAQVCKKLVIDQSFMAPTIITSFFFALGLMEFKPLPEIYQVGLLSISNHKKWKREIIPAMQGNYALWPAATFIGYKYVPLRHRVAYISGTDRHISILTSWSCEFILERLSILRQPPRTKIASHRIPTIPE